MTNEYVKSRKPDLVLRAMNKRTNTKSGKIGAAWSNPDGSISLRLDAGVVIEHHVDVIFTLFPNDREFPEEPVIPGVSKVWNQTKIVR
jgi:hypothetical protein